MEGIQFLLQTLPLTSATITWVTDDDSTTAVEYGPTTAYGYTATDGMTTNHRVKLSNLSPGTIYHFRVLSTDSENNLEISRDFTFMTAAPQPEAKPRTEILIAVIVVIKMIILILLKYRKR
ncbi:MAG: fibronectin type III domain-containing protein [Candidatus Hadarchaeales archaeon]